MTESFRDILTKFLKGRKTIDGWTFVCLSSYGDAIGKCTAIVKASNGLSATGECLYVYPSVGLSCLMRKWEFERLRRKSERQQQKK